jgi:glycosyltransferase involved in cell wall biosynthesis
VTEAAQPFFSVLIPVHNRRDLVLRALRSVIGQTEQDFEVVLVDDASTDGSLEAAKSFLVAHSVRATTIALPENGGIPVARNASLRAASGTIAAFLDSDDAWHPRYLSLLKSAFPAAARPLFAFTDYFSDGPRFSGPVRQFRPQAAGFDPIELMISRPFIHTMSCFAAPLAGIRAVGGFNERLSRFSDLDLYVRLLAGAGKQRKPAWQKDGFICIPQTAVLKTIHLENRSLEDYEDSWEEGKNAFLDQVFSYPCLRGRQALREICGATLAEGKKRFFANFH